MLGLGLGGFADGIVMHQLLQWHNMASAVVPPVTMEAMRRNMAWDGLFHLVTLALAVTGIFLLLAEAHRGAQLPRRRVLAGQLLLGWGIFNLVEGVIDHHVLGLHHVRDLPVHQPLYDWLFLGVGGVGLIVVGWMLATRGELAATVRTRQADALARLVER
ncbi:MAG TPA: DUF2243 domain-containing protein [Gemmatimonadales bacterium]|nr:DUF2243 domain-containing protein [Gemmatimonadales bacterium]